MSLLAIHSHYFYSWKSSWVKFYILSHLLTVISLPNYWMSFACATFEGWEDARTVHPGHVIIAWMRSAGRTLEFWVVPSFSDIVSLTSGGYPILLCRSHSSNNYMPRVYGPSIFPALKGRTGERHRTVSERNHRKLVRQDVGLNSWRFSRIKIMRIDS